MATKTRTVSKVTTSGGMKEARDIYKNRSTATPSDIIKARNIIASVVDGLSTLDDDLKESFKRFTYEELETVLGKNPVVEIDGKTSISFTETEVTVSSIDEKELLKLGTLLPDKYFVVKKTLNRSLIVKEALEGTLEPICIPYVAAHKEKVVKEHTHSLVKKTKTE